MPGIDAHEQWLSEYISYITNDFIKNIKIPKMPSIFYVVCQQVKNRAVRSYNYIIGV